MCIPEQAQQRHTVAHSAESQLALQQLSHTHNGHIARDDSVMLAYWAERSRAILLTRLAHQCSSKFWNVVPCTNLTKTR